MTSLGPLTPEPVATYVTEMPSISSVSTLPTERHIAGGGGMGHKPNGQKPKGSHGHTIHSSHISHTHVHSHSSKPPGLGATSLAHMTGTMPGGTSLGISRVAETVIGPGSATMGRPLAYSSNTIASSHAMGLGLRGWDGTETVGRRKTYGHKRPQCTVLEPNQLHGTRGHSHSQHFLPTQPYFVTNSKTEVTVWARKIRRKREEQDACGVVTQAVSQWRYSTNSWDVQTRRSSHVFVRRSWGSLVYCVRVVLVSQAKFTNKISQKTFVVKRMAPK